MRLKMSKTIIFCGIALGAGMAEAHFTTTELQWEICENSAETFLRKASLGSHLESSFSVTYFDSQDLQLLKNRTYFRVENKNKNGEQKTKSKLKVEFKDADQVDESWMDKHDVKCEFDLYGGKSLARCAMQNKFKSGEDALSEEQIKFVQKYRPQVNIQNWTSWGPYRGRLIEISNSVSVDETRVPGRVDPLIEFSVRVNTEKADQAYREMTSQLQANGVRLCPRQNGKFDRVLYGD